MPPYSTYSSTLPLPLLLLSTKHRNHLVLSSPAQCAGQSVNELEKLGDSLVSWFALCSCKSKKYSQFISLFSLRKVRNWFESCSLHCQCCLLTGVLAQTRTIFYVVTFLQLCYLQFALYVIPTLNRFITPHLNLQSTLTWTSASWEDTLENTLFGKKIM